MNLKKEFFFTSVSGRIPPTPGSDLGPIANLVGIWKGRGFNQIWRPFNSSNPQDRFLELNETIEVLEFDEIPGDIPNRGFLQGDINLHGVRYLQQVQDAHVVGPNGQLAGIHVEPGLWLSVPQTTNPLDPSTVVRQANIPHGSSFVAQGIAFVISSAPTFPPASIVPFRIGQPNAQIQFPETNLGASSQFRTPPGDIPNVTQDIVNDPNLVLRQAIAGQNIASTTILGVSTNALNPPTSGGGTSNIAFLQGTGNDANANAVQVDSTFWIEEIRDASGASNFQLQYSQTVLLNFNGLSWPHVSVATLLKGA